MSGEKAPASRPAPELGSSGSGPRALPRDVWKRRHRSVVVLAFAHLPVLGLVGMAFGFSVAHLVVELLPVAALAALAVPGRASRRWRTLAATGALLASSGILVHLTGGLIESHFHFFVVMSVVLLYHDWIVFVAAFVFVGVHHGVMGILAPASVYNHPAAWDQPLSWAGLHALFIAANCVAGIVNWKANEREQARSEAYAATLAQQAEELERTGNAKSEFLSRMSHELRTPLNAILGFGQILQMDDRLHDDAKDAVDPILRSGHHLLKLIDEVLDISRIEAGRMPLHPTIVDVDEVLATALELVGPLAREHDIRLHRTAGGDLWVTGDEQRLRQVLLNLLSNAVKYNRPSGEVLIVTRQEEGRVRIDVTDSGPGLAGEALDRLFVPFDRLDADDRTVEGTGLGLVISKHLVEAMGGELTATSQLGRGSTFSVTLPSAPAPAEIDAPLLAAEQQVPEAQGAVLDIVYIEDEPSNVELVRRILQRRPEVRLTAAADASVGLAIVREQVPDLVLMDLQLPGMDGERAIAELKADPTLQGVAVAVLSADASPARVQRLLSAGACTYITKPFDVTELLSLIDRVDSRSVTATVEGPRSRTSTGSYPTTTPAGR